MNIEELLRRMGSDPTKNMAVLLQDMPGFQASKIVPESNKYYTFVYKAKTKGIQYDQHPLILCGNVFNTGFTGYNVHWGSMRHYSFPEVRSNLCELSEGEFEALQDVTLARFVNT